MTRLRGRLLIRIAALGALLTVIVVVFDQVGLLTSLERWAYDRRARDCQQFTPAPTTELVHLDIDDPSTEDRAVGRFPWPRRRFAEILDELGVAGPKVVALDITFKRAQQEETTGPAVSSPDDVEFAAALRRLNCAIIPVDLSLENTADTPPVARAVHEELFSNPTLTRDEVARRLKDKGLPPAAVTEDLFLAVRRQAVFERILESSRHGQPSLAEVRAKLLPVQTLELNLSSPLADAIEEQYARVSATLAIARLAPPVPAATPPVTSVRDLLSPPLTPFGMASVATGFVSVGFFQEGAVRSLPLAVEVGGRLYPQLGLALACRMLDIDPASLRYTDRSVIIPRATGRDIVIPTHSQWSAALDADVKQVMDIPWFGTSNWETMYDFPKHAATPQHVPIVLLWEVCEARHRIERNNLDADRAVSLVLDDDAGNKLALDPARAKQYAARPPSSSDTAARKEIVRFTLAQLKEAGWIERYAEMKESEFDEDSRRQRDDLLNSKAALEMILQQNDQMQAQIRTQRDLLATKLRGKAVLIGWTATGAAADFVPTSLHAKCPGVVVHGAIFNAIMTQHFWRRAPGWVTIAITIVLGLATAFAASVLAPFPAALVAILLLGCYLVINGVLLLDYAGIIVGVSPPMVAIAVVWSGCTLRRIYVEGKERALITRRFSNYADPMLVDYVVEHPDKIKFDGQRKELTVVFTDLQGFTTISEKLGEKSVVLLNEYMGIMVPIIGRNRGYVNKFLGDGIMFFFGAPYERQDHAAVALKTVLEMQEAMGPFNERIAAQGLPPLIMRAGISTGEMVVGDAGSPDRSDYTVLGDAVNLGARLESGNKAIGTRLLANRRAKELGGDGLVLRAVGAYCYLGKSEGIGTYEVVGRAGEVAPGQLRLAELSKEMVETFAATRFEQCLTVIGKIETEFGSGKLTKLYRELVEKYLTEGPPVGFCGNIILSEK